MEEHQSFMLEVYVSNVYSDYLYLKSGIYSITLPPVSYAEEVLKVSK